MIWETIARLCLAPAPAGLSGSPASISADSSDSGPRGLPPSAFLPFIKYHFSLFHSPASPAPASRCPVSSVQCPRCRGRLGPNPSCPCSDHPPHARTRQQASPAGGIRLLYSFLFHHRRPSRRLCTSPPPPARMPWRMNRQRARRGERPWTPTPATCTRTRFACGQR